MPALTPITRRRGRILSTMEIASKVIAWVVIPAGLWLLIMMLWGVVTQ